MIMVHIYSVYLAACARTEEDSKEVLMSLIIIIMHDIILIQNLVKKCLPQIKKNILIISYRLITKQKLENCLWFWGFLFAFIN